MYLYCLCNYSPFVVVIWVSVFKDWWGSQAFTSCGVVKSQKGNSFRFAISEAFFDLWKWYGKGAFKIWALKRFLLVYPVFGECTLESRSFQLGVPCANSAGSFGISRMASDLNAELSKNVGLFGLKVWEVVGIIVGILIVFILFVLAFYLTTQKKLRRAQKKLPLSQIPTVSKEIKEVRVEQESTNEFVPRDGILLTIHDKSSDKESDKVMVHLGMPKVNNADNSSQSGSFHHIDKDYYGSQSGEEGSSGTFANKPSSSHPITAPSPLSGLPEFFALGLGHWFTLRDLQVATNRFSKDNVIGEGGYGVVYQGHLINGGISCWFPKANIFMLFYPEVKQREEFRVRMLVYEYVNNGNLEQWLHGAMRQHGFLTWEARMKVLLGTAKALAYLHEAIEPKVVHRDIKSSNILIDDEFNAKLWGLLLEAITGRDPVDYGRPAPEVNLVDWLKMMVGNRRSEEVVDPNMDMRPSTKALKRALLTALRCVDPDSDKRPRMSQVARMLESEEYPIPREDRRHRRARASSIEMDSQRDNYDTDKSDNQDLRSDSRRNY
ncbi:UNVERIFIED_CONTAM: putative receptor-like protein kinase [Sesamum angustifolium]|uniref:non-specific serine/threonine protein kinase n=1 Tax=Sesamum angustifolium TaxID=2727405 RepID=A0AAW2QAT3_9LAMI